MGSKQPEDQVFPLSPLTGEMHRRDTGRPPYMQPSQLSRRLEYDMQPSCCSHPALGCSPLTFLRSPFPSHYCNHWQSKHLIWLPCMPVLLYAVGYSRIRVSNLEMQCRSNAGYSVEGSPEHAGLPIQQGCLRAACDRGRKHVFDMSQSHPGCCVASAMARSASLHRHSNG